MRRVVSAIIKHIKQKGLLDLIELSWTVGRGLLDYWFSPHSMRASKLPDRDYDQLSDELMRIGLEVLPFHVDVAQFRGWLAQADFPEWYKERNPFPEKALEHYLSAKILDLDYGKIFVDVAAASSPWKDIAARLYGVSAFALDLINSRFSSSDNKLIADATQMPIQSGSVDSLALHCAYEAFEGDADIRLLPEADRVLRPGGRMVILPLYLHHLYYADSSPLADRRGLDYQGALRVWREDRGRVRFSRKYSIESFHERVVANLGSLSLKVYRIVNLQDVDPSCYCHFVAVFEKFK